MVTIKFPQQNQPSPRDRAQDIAWQAMECMGGDREQAAQLCREALVLQRHLGFQNATTYNR